MTASDHCSCRPSSAAYGRQRCSMPTLQRLCEQTVARQMVEPRSALALLEFADAAGAQLLRQHSLAVRNPFFAQSFPCMYPPCNSQGTSLVMLGGNVLHQVSLAMDTLSTLMPRLRMSILSSCAYPGKVSALEKLCVVPFGSTIIDQLQVL